MYCLQKCMHSCWAAACAKRTLEVFNLSAMLPCRCHGKPTHQPPKGAATGKLQLKASKCSCRIQTHPSGCCLLRSQSSLQQAVEAAAERRRQHLEKGWAMASPLKPSWKEARFASSSGDKKPVPQQLIWIRCASCRLHKVLRGPVSQ